MAGNMVNTRGIVHGFPILDIMLYESKTHSSWHILSAIKNTVKQVMLTDVIFNVFLKMYTLTEIKFNGKLVITNLINHKEKDFPPPPPPPQTNLIKNRGKFPFTIYQVRKCLVSCLC